jgi:hypothetical protein
MTDVDPRPGAPHPSESGPPSGVVSVTARLAGLQGMLDAAGLPAVVITLIDEHGIVLAQTRDFAAWVGRKLEDTAEYASGGVDVRSAALRTSADGAHGFRRWPA